MARSSVIRLHRAVVTAAAIVAAVLGGERSLPAQQGAGLRLPPGLDEALQPDLVRRDLQVIVESLQLDEAQQTIVEHLFVDYETVVAAGGEALREEIRERSEALLSEQLAGQRERQEEYRARMRALVAEIRERQQRNRDPRQAKALRDEFRRRAEEVRAQMQQPSSSAAAAVAREFFDTLEQWRRDKKAMRDAMLEGVMAILSDEQVELWPAFERQLTRQKLLGKGQLSAESINLLAVLNEVGLGPSARATVEPILGEYELALHAALLERERELDATRKPIMEAVTSGNERAIDAALDRQFAAHAAVRSVNDRFLDALVAALPSPLRERLVELARRRAYPQLFTPTLADRGLAAARRLRDLDDQVRAAVETLAGQYQAEREALNVELIRLSRAQEPARLRQALRQRWGASGFVTKPESPQLDRATARCRELADATAEQLRRLLTEEQAARVLGPSS